MLQIGIHRNHDVALCMVDARLKRGSLTAVAAELNDAQHRFACSYTLHDLKTVVPAPVVDENDFKLKPIQKRSYCTPQAIDEAFDHALLVIHRRNDTDFLPD